jgi:hypothetical protein
MLDDGDAGGKQQRVRGPLTVGGVVDVERIDADECGVMISEPGCGCSSIAALAANVLTCRISREPGVRTGPGTD